MARRDHRDDAGSSSVVAVGLVALLLTLTVASLAVLSAVRAAHVARSSADLAALAGAVVHQQSADPTAACAEAERIALRHDVEMVECAVGAGGVVTVTASAPITHRLAGVGPERAQGVARAGPDPGDTDQRTGGPRRFLPARGNPLPAPDVTPCEGGHLLVRRTVHEACRGNT